MIFETTDYDMFKVKDTNREVKIEGYRAVKNSIMARNKLAFRPIIVDKEMRVIDGQHRLKAARELNLPIYYQIDEDSADEDIILLNANQNNWRMSDYYKYFINKSSPEYLKLQNFIEKNNLTFNLALSLISDHKGMKGIKFKNGLFKFPDDLTELNKKYGKLVTVQEMVDRFYEGRKEFITKPTFIRGFITFLDYTNLDFEIFINRLEERFDKFRKCSTCADYLRLFISIYNYRNPRPITYSD